MKKRIIAIVGLLLILAACSDSGTAEFSGAGTEGPGATVAEDASGVTSASAGNSQIGVGSEADALSGRKIIRRATLTVRDDNPEATFLAIVELAEASGGFVATSNLQRTDGDEPPRIDLTLRLPSGRLTATIGSIGNLVDEVLARALGSDDVTAEYLDIGARLRNLGALESELLTLLSEVREVSDPEATDLLLVFDRLQTIRLEIERLQGRQQIIDDQVDLATLDITIVPTPADVEIADDSWDPGRRVREALASLVRVFEGLANLAIWVGFFFLPVVAAVAIPIGLFWWATRRRRRSAAVDAPPEGSTPTAVQAEDPAVAAPEDGQDRA